MTAAFNQKIPPAASILIILMGSLGDVARGLCLVAQIKENLPQSRVTWLVEPKWEELVRLHVGIDRVVVFERAWRLSALWKLFQDLNQEHFDISIDLQRILKSGFFALLSGAPRRVGFHRRNAKEFNWIFNNEHIPFYGDDLPKIQHYLKFTAYLGLSDPKALNFGLSALSARQIAPRLQAQLSSPFVAVVLGSSWESKNWVFEGYLELIRRILSGPPRKVVLLGDKAQLSWANDLARSIGGTGLVNLVGRTTLTELVAVLKSASAAVGPDSGPGHIAAAVDTPFVTLFGPTSPARTAPFGYEDLVVRSETACAPCYQKRCPERMPQCMFDIDAAEVMQKVSAALAASARLK